MRIAVAGNAGDVCKMESCRRAHCRLWRNFVTVGTGNRKVRAHKCETGFAVVGHRKG